MFRTTRVFTRAFSSPVIFNPTICVSDFKIATPEMDKTIKEKTANGAFNKKNEYITYDWKTPDKCPQYETPKYFMVTIHLTNLDKDHAKYLLSKQNRCATEIEFTKFDPNVINENGLENLFNPLTKDKTESDRNGTS
jgi:hypothetical protein